MIESSHHDVILILADDEDALDRAVLDQVQSLHSDRPGDRETLQFLAEHPYPQSDDQAAIRLWVAAIRDLMLDPYVTYFDNETMLWAV